MQLLKKISRSTVFGTKADVQKLVLEDQKKNHFLYRVYGEATGFMKGPSKFIQKDKETGEETRGEWHGLAGEFEAINSDGEVFNAVTCFLPNYITGPIVEHLRAVDTTGVVIAFDIFAQFDETSATSYIMLASPVRRNDTPESKLDEMRKALPAPEGVKGAALKAIAGKK